MYCPRCGGDVFEQLFGGSCQTSCVYCQKAIRCRCLFSGEIEPDSMPIFNQLVAKKLREVYDQVPENKIAGQKNIEENEAYHNKRRENDRRIEEVRQQLEERLTNKRQRRY